MNFKKYLDTNLVVSLLLFSIVWTLVNNSYDLSRDEMWYADYSIKYNDTETRDIRHLSENDIHQVAFSHVYRNIERGMGNFIKKPSPKPTQDHLVESKPTNDSLFPLDLKYQEFCKLLAETKMKDINE